MQREVPMLENQKDKRNRNIQTTQRQLNLSLKSKFWAKVNSRDKQLFDNYIPFGYAFLSNRILQKENSIFFSSKISQVIQSSKWQISVKSDDEDLMWSRRFELIRQCQATNLQIKIGPQHFKCFTFKYLQPVDFPDLLVLNLHSCRINNIENLAHLNAPKLMTINLIYNQIYTFKSLAKSSLNLKYLFVISRSSVQNIARFLGKRNIPQAFIQNYSRWNCPLINLRLQKYQYNSIGMNDLAFLAKRKPSLNGIQLNVNINPRKRIEQIKVIKTLKKSQINFQIFVSEGLAFPQEYEQLYRPRQ